MAKYYISKQPKIQQLSDRYWICRCTKEGQTPYSYDTEFLYTDGTWHSKMDGDYNFIKTTFIGRRNTIRVFKRVEGNKFLTEHRYN